MHPLTQIWSSLPERLTFCHAVCSGSTHAKKVLADKAPVVKYAPRINTQDC